MSLVTAIFRGILRAFRGDLSLAPRFRPIVQCASVVAFAAAALVALPASAQSDPFAQPGGVSKPSAPIILPGRDYVVVPDAEYRNFTIKWTRPANSGGGRILEYRITRSKAELIGAQDPARCDLLGDPGNGNIRYAADSYEAFVGPDVFELSDETNIAHRNCVQWHISARNAAGWGPAAETNPLLTRAGSTDRCGPGGAQAPTLPVGLASSVTCPGLGNLENSDWCKRLTNGKLIYREGDEKAAGNDSRFYLVCELPASGYNCDGRYAVRGPREGVTWCGINAGTYCGTYSNYDVRHRECICARLTEVKSVTHKSNTTPANVAGVQTCGCDAGVANPIAGIDTGTCRCPAGKTYYPDTHACETTLPEVEKDFNVNPITGQGGEKTVEDGVVKINHTRSVAFVLTITIPTAVFENHPGWITVQVGDAATPLCTGRFFQLNVSGAKRIFRATCEAPIRAGKHDIAAKFRISGHDFVAPLKVHVGTDAQGECERKNPAVNPVGGTFLDPDIGGQTCLLDPNAFVTIDDDSGFAPQCRTDIGETHGAGNCRQHYAELRAAGCNPPETKHKKGYFTDLPSVSQNSDYSCICTDSGEPAKADGSCHSEQEKALIAEVKKLSPNLAAVRALLAHSDVNPNLSDGGVPLLVIAATLLHAEVVSVMITAGADVSVKFGVAAGNLAIGDTPVFVPMLLAQLAASDNPLSANRRFVETFVHFSDAAGDKFNWGYADSSTQNIPVRNIILGYMARRHTENLKFTSDLAQNPFLERAGWYMQDRGGVCPNSQLYRADSPVCAGRPACPATSSGTYSCSQCDGYPLYSRDAGACVTQCGINEEADTTTWPDEQCLCKGGVDPDEFGCPSEHDQTLLEELNKPSPDLAAVRLLLDQGARPNIASGGVPLLFIAATLGHAEAVSVLITAGADPNTQIRNPMGGDDYLPEYLGRNGLTGTPASAEPILPWRSAASVLIYFGDAARLSAVTYDWARARPRTNDEYPALEHLRHRYDVFGSLLNSEENQEAAELMAGYMLDQGAACPAGYTSHALCTSRLTCASISGGKRAHCGGCPGRPYRSAAGDSCVESCDAVKERATTDAHWLDPSCDCAPGYELITDPATGGQACGKRLVPEQAPFLDAALVGPPGAPTVALSWQTPVNEGPELVRYEFWHGFANPGANAPDCSQADFGSQLDSPSAAFPGVLATRTEAKQSVVNNYGQCAVYRIAGVNALGAGPPRESARLYIQHAPGPPGAVAVSLLVNSRISLSWSPVSEANRLGAVISGYEVLRKVDGGDFVSVGFSPEPSYVDNTPPLGARVRYQARAQSSAGAGAPSGESAALDVPGERINYDEALEDELAKDTPSLATVRLYLSSGGSANVTINGVAALLSAAEKGRADLVRALVLAGADVNARHPGVFDRNVAHLMAHNRVGEDKDADLRLRWETARDVLLAFGDALARRGALFNWDASDGRGSRALEYFFDNYLPATEEGRSAMERMANYMIARGASCRDEVKDEQAQAAQEGQPDLCEGSPGPGAPDGFSAALGGATRTQVTLSWLTVFANAAPVTGYKFWRVGGAPAAGKSDCAAYSFPSITPSTPTVAIAAAAAARTAVHVLGEAGYGHCHRYGIAAINANGEGAIAESAGFYAQYKPVTLAPPRVSVGLDRVPVVFWDRLTNRVTELRGAVIEQYQLQRRTGAGGTWADPVNVAQSESSYREDAGNIMAGETYYYRIRTWSSAGLGDYSDPASSGEIPMSSGNCAIGQFEDSSSACRVIGASCVAPARTSQLADAKYDNTFWRERNGRAVCACKDGYEYLDAVSKRYCARSGEPGEPRGGSFDNLGDSENPAMIQTAIAACTAAGYVSQVSQSTVVESIVGRVLGYRAVCQIHTRRADSASSEEDCVLATQEFVTDKDRRPDTHLLGVLFCHHVFPLLEGTQASVGVVPQGHDATNPYVYGECPPGQDLSREFNRCLKNCSSGPSANLGRGEVSGLELIRGESAEEDRCECPSGEFLNGTACVAACSAGERPVTDEGGLTSCLGEANVGNAREQCGDERIVGTYAAGNLAVLCPVGRDINALDSETVYTSGACWLSASPGFKASLPSPTDANYIPSCEDLAGEPETPGNPPSLPTDFMTGTEPISFGDCPDGKALKEGADCECENAGEFEQGSYCFEPSGEVIPEDADKGDLRKLCEEAFRGRAEEAGNGQLVCSQVDANDTFCILGSDNAFPCEGLFRHVRDCNLSGRPDANGRPALNPFWCGKPCELGYAAGDECVFTSSQFQEALGATVESLRATVAVAAGHQGAVYTVNFARTITNAAPLFAAEESRLYWAGRSNGVVGVLPANSGDARSSLALIRVAHSQDERVYFLARVFLDWVDAPQYDALTHSQYPERLTSTYAMSRKFQGNAHTLLTFEAPEGGDYELRKIIDAQGNEVAENQTAAEQHYRLSADRGSVSLGANNALQPGTYEFEVYFTHSEMAGTLILRVPVVVTN